MGCRNRTRISQTLHRCYRALARRWIWFVCVTAKRVRKHCRWCVAPFRWGPSCAYLFGRDAKSRPRAFRSRIQHILWKIYFTVGKHQFPEHQSTDRTLWDLMAAKLFRSSRAGRKTFPQLYSLYPPKSGESTTPAWRIRSIRERYSDADRVTKERRLPSRKSRP